MKLAPRNVLYSTDSVSYKKWMARLEASIYIHAPPEAVWALLANLSHIPEYVPFVRDVFDVAEPPVRTETTYAERATLGPFASVSRWRITVWSPPRRQVHVGTMPGMELTLTVELIPTDNGTHYSQSMEFVFLPKPWPVGRLLARLLMRRKLTWAFPKIVERIKQIVETEHAGRR